MPATANLNDLPDEIANEIKEIGLRVTQGMPAFRALKCVLSDGEWLLIEDELKRYFPPTRKHPNDQLPRRPSYYAIKTLMRIRKISQPRAKYSKGDHQISERRLLEYLKRVLKRLGLKGHLHTFRHAFISHALTQGVPEAIVRQWVGHVDPEVIKLYTHIADQASQAAMRRLAGAGPQDSPPAREEKEAHVERPGGDSDSAQIKHKDQEGQNGQSAK
jgi:hypothetical protein